MAELDSTRQAPYNENDVEMAAVVPSNEKAQDQKHAEYDLPVDPEQDDRATELKIQSFKQPHMRAFHCSWLGFFSAFMAWFAIAPLLPVIKETLELSKKDVWVTNICSVASTVFMRFLVGPLCDMYGPKTVMAALMILGSIPTYCIGAVTSFEGLCVVRFFIGAIGASFVMCQYWTSQMFAKNVVGTANAIVGGWGNLGGGVTQLFMGAAMWPLFLVFTDGDKETAWRTIFIVPATITVAVGFFIYFFSQDTPHGDFKELRANNDLPPTNSLVSFFMGFRNYNTVLMFIQYGCCFGVELTMNNAAATYFHEEFDQSVTKAASIASSFGFMNLVARGLGGYLSDTLNKKFSMRGRLLAQFVCLFMEGVFLLVFSAQRELGAAIGTMIIFSVCVQAAEGASFGIVPYIDPPNLGAVSGIVGAGGNLGAVIFGLTFLYGINTVTSLRNLGIIVIISSLLTFFYKIPGYQMLTCGKEDPSLQVSNSRRTFGDKAGRGTNKA